MHKCGIALNTFDPWSEQDDVLVRMSDWGVGTGCILARLIVAPAKYRTLKVKSEVKVQLNFVQIKSYIHA